MQQQLINSMTQIPDDIARFAHEQQLGAPQGSYMITQLRRGWRWLLILFPLAIFIIFSSLVVLVITLSLSDPNLFLLTHVFIPLIAIAYVLLMASLIASKFTNRFGFLYSCDKGLIFKQSRSKFRVIRWNEIETIWQTSARLPRNLYFTSHIYTIRCHDGYILTFSCIRRLLHNLDKTIEEQFTRRHLPFQFADYQAGQLLHFGPLSINREGVCARGKMLPWEQITDISLLKNRRLLIHKTGERPEVWLNLPTHKIPNLSIFLALFKQIRSGQSEQAANFETLATYGTAAMVVQSRGKIDALPDELATLAEEHKLGERRLDQRLGRSRLTNWAIIITLLILQAIMLAIMVGYTVNLTSLPSFNQELFFALFTDCALFSLFLTTFTIISITRNLRHIHNYTYTFERGIILKRGQQAPVVCRWEEIETVWRIPAFAWYSQRQQPYLQQRLYAYIFQLHNGAKYTLTRLNINQEALGKLIHEQVVPQQSPAAVAAFQADQTLSFGKVGINHQGITVNACLLPWPQIKSVSLQENRLVIYDITQRQPWCRLSAKRIPNLYLLFALADYARDIAAH